MGDFDSVKIGVCDAYWTPAGKDPTTDEIFLGLTKGGCELTYTPEWYDLSVDRYGKSPTDSALVGESISVKIPLAETDMNKIKLFSHTGKIVYGASDSYKLTFGRFPGFRLGEQAGRLRLHPIAMGVSKEEDVVIYKSVNKAPLQLNYKLDEERIYQTEFIGMIKRSHISGAMLWEIGDSTIGDAGVTLSETLDINGLPTNLQEMVEKSGGSFWISVPRVPVYSESSDINLRTVTLDAYCEFNGNVYKVTPLVTFALPTTHGAGTWSEPIVRADAVDGLPTSAPDLVADAVGSDSFASVTGNTFVAKTWETDIQPNGYYRIKSDPALYPANVAANWIQIQLGDDIWVVVDATWGTLTADASVVVQMA